MDLDLYNFSFGTHRDKNVIWIRFEKNNTLIQELVKTFHLLGGAVQTELGICRTSLQ